MSLNLAPVAEIDNVGGQAVLFHPGPPLIPAIPEKPTWSIAVLKKIWDIEEAVLDIKDTASAIIKEGTIADIRESDNRVRTLGSAAIVGAIGAAGSLKIPLIASTQAVLGVLEHTQNSLATGVAAAVVFGGWNRFVAKGYDMAMTNFPRTIFKMKEKIPGWSNTLSQSLPGLNDSSPEKATAPKQSLLRRLGRRASIHLRRGATIEGVGVAPYILSAHTQDKSPEEISTLSNKASIDGGVVAGTVAGVGAAIIIRIGDTNPQLAEQIQESAGNTKILVGAAIALMGLEYTTNRRRSKKAAAEPEQLTLFT